VGIVPQDWVGHFVSFILGQSFGIQTGARIWAFLEKVLLARKNNSRLKRLSRSSKPKPKVAKKAKAQEYVTN
jgi:hypothetical protein